MGFVFPNGSTWYRSGVVSKVTRICPLDLTERFSIHVSFGNCQMTLVVMGDEGEGDDETSTIIDASRSAHSTWWIGILSIRRTSAGKSAGHMTAKIRSTLYVTGQYVNAF